MYSTASHSNSSRAATCSRRLLCRTRLAHCCQTQWNLTLSCLSLLQHRGPNTPGARAAVTRCAEERVSALENYLDDDCTLTLSELRHRLFENFGVRIPTSTVSAKLVNKLITVKQVHTIREYVDTITNSLFYDNVSLLEVRRVPSTCNNEVNQLQRQTFSAKLIKHISDGEYIVYYDETNYNLFCMQNQGRAMKGERAVVICQPSQGKNLQVQYAVSTEDGLVLHQPQWGSIRMEENADFAKKHLLDTH
ncbi:hypothetical protein PHMEG_0008786 [Phytophthora megakarya]|uniref:Uncharacterized protein n=1 Tax=Phytophthora megakarya TaxID=4795 RepID=A0A225WJI5_9STRA|nr:hypothetical protein PHMEG_0008786 [Phytophthora megakarya]